MDATASGATARGFSLPMSSSSSSQKEWRAVSDHHQPRSADDEVQQESEPVDVDFCSVTIDENLDQDILQQRLHTIATQREELQQVEIEIRAQIIVRSEIMEMQNCFDAQLKEHANAASRLQEQLHEREQAMHELERRMEEKDRELHSVKLDNEAAWAKEDLLRDHDKELETFKRERDHSEVERAQHIKQLHELQEQIQEKEKQLMELQEQHRVAQEAILFKDDQLREAQTWIARVQEIDALQSNSLQAELRDRTEQYNHVLLVWQRQFAEMERHHVHTIQQLQLELADGRERIGTYTEESQIAQTNPKDASQVGQNNGNHLDVNGGVTSSESSGGLLNGNSGCSPWYASNGGPLTQSELVAGVTLAPSSLPGVPAYLPPAQHPFIIHQPAVPHSVPSHIPQSHVTHIQSMPAVTSHQQWQNQHIVPEASQPSAQNPIPPTQTDQHLLSSDAKYDYDGGQALRSDYLDAHFSHGMGPDSTISSSSVESQVIESTNKSYVIAPRSELSLQQISSEFHDTLKFDSHEQEHRSPNVAIHGLESQGLIIEQTSSTMNTSLPNPNVSAYSDIHGEASAKNGQANSLTVNTLLNEKSLLTCVVRTIPAGGRIRISSTLPNRLGKMLAPLHWHDYRKKHGKLEDFVASHPELFVIEGDYIQLQEGAQEMIAATAAVAKVAAAAAASTPHSSVLPSVAVTPMSHSHRLKKFSSINSKHVKNDSSPQLSELQTRHTYDVSSDLPGGPSNIKNMGKSKDHPQQNGNDTRSGQFANGANLDTPDFSRTQIRGGSTNGWPSSNYVVKQFRRTTGAARR